MGFAMRTPAQTRATFAHYFETWDIQLPEELPEGEGCPIPNDRGWSIRVKIDRTDDEHVVEVYARHRMTNDRHFLIHEEGRLEGLEAPPDYTVYPAGSAEEERAQIRASSAKDNRRIHEALRQRGLT
jgi:hypothetical protein